MKSNYYCNLADDEYHQCGHCDFCYCKEYYVTEEYELSDTEIDEIIEKEIAKAQAIFDSI